MILIMVQSRALRRFLVMSKSPSTERQRYLYRKHFLLSSLTSFSLPCSQSLYVLLIAPVLANSWKWKCRTKRIAFTYRMLHQSFLAIEVYHVICLVCLVSHHLQLEWTLHIVGKIAQQENIILHRFFPALSHISPGGGDNRCIIYSKLYASPYPTLQPLASSLRTEFSCPRWSCSPRNLSVFFHVLQN